MSATRLIDIHELMAITGLGKTSVYERIKKGEFRPIKLGSRTKFSHTEGIDWVEAQLASRVARSEIG